MADEVKNSADEELMRLATEGDDDQQQDDTLELTEEVKPKVEAEGGEDQGDDDAEKQKRETRSRRWQARVDALTARLREAERRAADAEAKIGGGKDADEPAPNPNDEKYEFGEADPRFIMDMAGHEARRIVAEERDKARESDAKTAQQAEIVGKLHEGMANIETVGTEKYEDFEEKIEAAVEARGGEPLPPLVSIGIAVSPAGADIAYKLATDEAASERIERLARTNPQAAAIAFGELEGEFLDNDADDDLDPSDPLDMARMLGRERARRKGGGTRSAGSVERTVTKAPKPAEQRARGAHGQFEVPDDTDDFAAFEKKVMGNRA